MKEIPNAPFKIYLHNRTVTITTSFEGVVGDTLDISEMFGHMTGSADKFCRECLVSRAEFHNDITYVGEPKTYAHYLACITRASAFLNGSFEWKRTLSAGVTDRTKKPACQN